MWGQSSFRTSFLDILRKLLLYSKIIFRDTLHIDWKSGTAISFYCIYYMAGSASGQDDPNRALWLATRAGKMEPSCPLGTTRCIPQEKFLRKLYNKSFIDQVCSVKMAWYWPRFFFASLWTSTSSRSINTQKKNLANIQPSWPHTWSLTHMYLKFPKGSKRFSSSLTRDVVIAFIISAKLFSQMGRL